MNFTTRTLAAIVAIAASASVFAQTIELTPIPSGAMRKVGFYMPHHVVLSDAQPASIKKAPAGLQSPVYGEIKMQGKTFAVIVDRPANGDAKLYVDTNGDGDLTNDPAAVLTRTEYKSQDKTKTWQRFMGSGTLDLVVAGQPIRASLGFYVFDPSDTDRSKEITHSLFFYDDFAAAGKMTLSGKSYDVVLDDVAGDGSFSAAPGQGNSGVYLLIDRLGTGNFNNRADQYDATKPFNIGGTTYAMSGLGTGSSITLSKSSQTVAEVPLPMVAGQKAIAFDATSTDGKAVQFPGDYKGHVVLLDFWATWCGPCMGEVPNVVAAYKKYHDQGFEILGISLDNDQTVKNLKPVTQDKEMTWRQVCDGKFWNAAVAKLYSVQAIPQAYLVDGDTGQIIAEGDALRGEGLTKQLETAFAKRKHSP